MFITQGLYFVLPAMLFFHFCPTIQSFEWQSISPAPSPITRSVRTMDSIDMDKRKNVKICQEMYQPYHV